MKRFFSILLSAVMVLGLLAGCAQNGAAQGGEETVDFTDSLGRTTKISPAASRRARSSSVAL